MNVVNNTEIKSVPMNIHDNQVWCKRQYARQLNIWVTYNIYKVTQYAGTTHSAKNLS